MATVTTNWPLGLAVTENGPAVGGTSVPNPCARSPGVGPAASSASVSARDSGPPGRSTELSRSFLTRYKVIVVACSTGPLGGSPPVMTPLGRTPQPARATDD